MIINLKMEEIEIVISVFYVIGIYMLYNIMRNCFVSVCEYISSYNKLQCSNNNEKLMVSDKNMIKDENKDSIVVDQNKKIDKIMKDVERHFACLQQLKKETNTYNFEQIIIDITVNSNQIKEIQNSIEIYKNDLDALNQQVKTMRRRLAQEDKVLCSDKRAI